MHTSDTVSVAEVRGARVLMTPMHPGIQYHFARTGLPVSLLGNWEQFQYWRPKPSNVRNLLAYDSRHLTFLPDDYRCLLRNEPGLLKDIDLAWLHFPWQAKLFGEIYSGRKIYFAAKQDELSEEEWENLFKRDDFRIASYYPLTTQWIKRRFGVDIEEIQLGVCSDEYDAWTGEDASILSVIHSWSSRGWNYNMYLEATDGLPTRHVDHLDKKKPLVRYDALLALFRSSAVYFHDGEREYTIALIEAMMTGMPIVTPDLPGIAAYVEHGVNGFVGSDAKTLRDYCQLLLNDRALAERLGRASREKALRNHSETRWRADWQAFVGAYR